MPESELDSGGGSPVLHSIRNYQEGVLVQSVASASKAQLEQGRHTRSAVACF